MASFEVEGRSIWQGYARFPWVGPWVAGGCITGDAPPPAVGTQVKVKLGDVEGVGTVLVSGTHAGRPEVVVVGGFSNGWAKILPPRTPYRMPSGVKLSMVVDDLAREAGERAVVAPEVKGLILGVHFSRPESKAATALETIRVDGQPLQYHVRLDGSTWIGPRPTFKPAPGVEIVPVEVQCAGLFAVLKSPTDSYSQMMPGALLGIPGLPSDRPVKCLDIIIGNKEAKGHVWLHDESGGLRLDAQETSRWIAQLYGSHSFLVESQQGPHATLRPLSTAQGMHDELAIEMAYGVPGFTATLQRNAPVLVTWRNGNPAQPVVTGYASGVLPLRVTSEARDLTELKTTEPLTETTGVHVGGHRPVAMGDAVETHLAGWRTLLRSLAEDFVRPMLSDPQKAALDALLLAEEAAYDAASGPAGLGFSSTKLGTG